MSKSEDRAASARISQFRMAKGVTLENKNGQWTKKMLSLVVQLPSSHSDEDVAIALTRAEYVLDSFLGSPETVEQPQPSPTQHPSFDSEDLMKHQGWKSKKIGEKAWKDGSLSWGWDFRENFKPETIQALDRGPLSIDEYEFTATDTIVNTKKKKLKK